MEKMKQAGTGNRNIVQAGNIQFTSDLIVVNGKVVANDSNIVEGDGEIVPENRNITSIRRVELDGPVKMVFHQGVIPSLAVTADKNILPLISTEVTGDTLAVQCRGSFCTDNEIQIDLVLPGLEHIYSNGSGLIELFDLDQPSLALELFGSGDICAQGQAGTLSLVLLGSGGICAQKLEAQNARVVLRGSGDIRVRAVSRVDAQIYGSGDIEISGNPLQRNCSTHSSGEILWNNENQSVDKDTGVNEGIVRLETVEKVVRAVENSLRVHKVDLTPVRKAELIRLLCEQAEEVVDDIEKWIDDQFEAAKGK